MMGSQVADELRRARGSLQFAKQEEERIRRQFSDYVAALQREGPSHVNTKSRLDALTHFAFQAGIQRGTVVRLEHEVQVLEVREGELHRQGAQPFPPGYPYPTRGELRRERR